MYSPSIINQKKNEILKHNTLEIDEIGRMGKNLKIIWEDLFLKMMSQGKKTKHFERNRQEEEKKGAAQKFLNFLHTCLIICVLLFSAYFFKRSALRQTKKR